MALRFGASAKLLDDLQLVRGELRLHLLNGGGGAANDELIVTASVDR
ncbi:MAG: hypothetical protein ACREMP_06600 [Candidatus Tyrphobacter sp.]